MVARVTAGQRHEAVVAVSLLDEVVEHIWRR